MFESGTEASQDHLNCSVCLNVLMDPVTIPCGHSYCMKCIKECWDEEGLQKKAYSCPQCRGLFPTRPVLNRSTVLTDVLRGLKSPADMEVKLNGGECNFCSGEKRRAVKSCLTCVASFCETHLKTHLEFPVLQRHTLVEPCSRLQEMLCPLHNKLLDVYCVQDKRCICLLCAMDEHSDHKTVSAAKEWSEQRQKPLQNLQERFPRLLQRREKDLQALNKAVKTYSTSAQAAVKLNESFLAEITQSMEKKLSQLSNLIQAYEKKELCQAEGLQKKLEQTIARLKLSDAECDQLRHTDQHILCLQEFLSLSAFSETEGLQSNPVKENPSFLNAAGLLSGLKEELEKLFDEKMKEMTSAAIKLKIVLPANPKTRQEFQEYFCQLKLSPESSHASLTLSEENRKVMQPALSSPIGQSATTQRTNHNSYIRGASVPSPGDRSALPSLVKCSTASCPTSTTAMTKKKAKAKKHKKERKRSPTPPCEDRGKRKDDRETPHRSKERNKHEHVSRRKSSDSSRLATEDSPKKETYKKKSDVKIKQAVFRNKISQDSDHRASHSSVKCSSLEYYVPSTGKSSSSQTLSRSASVVSSEEQRKKLVKRRSTSEEKRQRSPKAAFLPEEKSKKIEKRKSLPEEGYPVAKRQNTAEQVDVGVVHRKSTELTEQRKKLVDHRSRELRQEVVSEGKCSCPIKRENEHSKETSSSIKNTKATQHVGPKMQDRDRQRGQSHSAHHQTSGVELSSCPRLPVTFKIPKKSSVVKAQTGTDVWDDHKTSAVIKKHSIPVSVSSPPAQPNKLRPTDVSARVPPCLETHKTSLPQVQLGQSSPLRERSAPRNTAIQHAVCQGTSTVHTETFDNDQEMQLVEELHLARSDKRLQVNVVESCGELTCMDVDPPEEGITEAHSHGQHLQDLLIVLDTNVLLSHLDFVKKMRSHGLGALGFPTLLVPWVVLQELDSLKSGKLSREVEHKARPAVHYIYSCLKSQEPRLWGQSMQQASQASCGLGVVNNDDRVLQCCLQYQMLYPEGTLILCTNDKNLCSKALLSGVNALSKADLWEQAEGNPGLLNRSHSQHAACPPVGHTKEEHERKLCDEEEEASRRTASCAEWQLSECVPVLESNLQSALSAVLEEEMKTAYGELWTEIVYLKPPWTLEAVLQCFRKHWIAVFGNIIKRNLLSCVEMLSSCLCLGASVERSSVLTALHAAEELLMELSSRSQYSGHVATALSCLQTLRHRLQGQERTVEDTSDGDTLMAEAVEDVAPSHQTSPNEVWAFFESLWNNVCHVSSTLFSALQYSPDSVETVQLFFTTPPQDALTCLHRLSTALTQLLEAFQRVLSVDSTVMDAQTLLTVIHTSEIASVEPRFTAKDLFECLSQREYREKLCVGGAQLMELRANLDRCAATVCGQSESRT
ncbi:hypothetical protein MHYP_G00051490 [Metynnis hypsauchen]